MAIQFDRRLQVKGLQCSSTDCDVLLSKDMNLWHTAEDISILAGIAGLFHDFGKANKLFQKKINPKIKTEISEPYRHEWVSLRLFEAFVADQTDEVWLKRLAKVSSEDEQFMLDNLFKDTPREINNPFSEIKTRMSKFAQAIAWLIVSHHRLPKPKYSKEDDKPRIENIETWMTGKRFNGSWNSPKCQDKNWSPEVWEDLWSFPQGTPMLSKTWQDKAHSLATRALKRSTITKCDWLKDRFSLHLSRMVMMLSDHYYSSIQPTLKWQDKSSKAYANTDRKTRQLNQKLDEHNVGVGHNAFLMLKTYEAHNIEILMRIS